MTTGTRVVTFGKMPSTPPKFTLTEVHFPELARLDEGTKEGFVSRVLTSAGGDSRSLPRTIFTQFSQAPGHDGSVATGSLHEVTLDGETGVLSGKGFIIDNPDGRKMAVGIASQTLFHNSVDLAEVKVEFIEHGDFFDDDFTLELRFVEWKLAATTIVGTPAFADAHAVIPDDFDLTAALEAGPLVANMASHEIRLDVAESDEEVAASAEGLPSWDLFHRPEPDNPHKIIVGQRDENGWVPVYGHLALWGSCHDGIEGHCVVPPRPADGYASFNQPSVLTDRGQVEAGPITLFGGHIPLHKAADDPANAWADVRVVPGVHGPWLSGVVRPHVAVDDAKTYVARASRISGHWKGGRLKMIVCCNAEGYSVPGTGFTLNAAGEVAELVASFPVCAGDPEPIEHVIEEIEEAMVRQAKESDPATMLMLGDWMSSKGWTTTTTTNSSIEYSVEETLDVDVDESEFDVDIERERRIRRLRLTQT